MKKIIALVALTVVATAASASGTTGFTKYDFDNANSGQGFRNMNEVQVGVKGSTRFGSVDAAIVGRQLSPAAGVRDNGVGFEVGYNTGLKLAGVDLTGRAALGRVNLIDGGGAGFVGNTQYYSLAVEAAMPLTPSVTGFVGYRFRDAFSGTGPTQNRFTVGVDFAATKAISIRTGYAFTKQAGINFNGITTAVSYAF